MPDNKLTPSDFHLLKKELEAQGEFLSQESLDRKAEADKIKIEIESLKKILTQLLPNFQSVYQEAYEKTLREFDPDTEKKTA